ncbi:MAG: MarR family transcriptional regulator [Solirubrobacteraceae bacterium]
MDLGRQITRSRNLDEIAEALPRRATMLSHLFIKHSSLAISRTEIGVLRAAYEQPQRITSLAAAEGVTQPAITLLVNRMEERGWVLRRHDPTDRRAVLVALTTEGRAAFEELRAEYRALLHEEMATLSDDDIEVLARAVEVLDHLVDRLTEREQ